MRRHIRPPRAPDFEKVVSMMLASRKYTMSHQWAYPQHNLDMRYTALVWKNLTAVERFNGEDLGVLLYGNSRYRYFHDNAPVLEIPLVERTDFYDCRETFDGGGGGGSAYG